MELFAGQFGPLLDRTPGSGPSEIWIAGLTGRLGWLDYDSPEEWVHRIGFWGALAVLAIVGLGRCGWARRSVPVDAIAYAAAVVGLALLIARSGLNARLAGAIGFEQARYLAVRCAGRSRRGARSAPTPHARPCATGPPRS